MFVIEKKCGASRFDEVTETKLRSMCPGSRCLVSIQTPQNSALLSPNHTPSAGRAPAGQSSILNDRPLYSISQQNWWDELVSESLSLK